MSTSVTLLIILGGLLVVALVVAVWGISVYNQLVALRQRFGNAYTQIDVQLQRRYDLIPNMVEIAKGYMAHESKTLEAVIKARNAAHAAAQGAIANPSDPDAMRGLLAAEGALGVGLGRMMVLAESYPTLKADTHMLSIQAELTATENKVSFSRQAYNDAVMVYNITREQFPGSMIANFGGFLPAIGFTVENPEERKAPKISF